VALSLGLEGTRVKQVVVGKQSLVLVESMLAENCVEPELRIAPSALKAD
jgi:hypothetical protein